MNFSNSNEISESHIKVSVVHNTNTASSPSDAAIWLGHSELCNDFPKFFYTAGLVSTLIFPTIDGAIFRKSKLAD